MDNKGWGLNTMILMVSVIVIALLIATFFSIRINALIGQENNETEKKVSKAINETYYINQTNKVTLATENYIDEHDLIITDTPLIIDINTLIAYEYIEPIKDYVTNNRCSAYSKAYLNKSNIRIINSYIKCDNYETKGYGENR